MATAHTCRHNKLPRDPNGLSIEFPGRRKGTSHDTWPNAIWRYARLAIRDYIRTQMHTYVHFCSVMRARKEGYRLDRDFKRQMRETDSPEMHSKALVESLRAVLIELLSSGKYLKPTDREEFHFVNSKLPLVLRSRILRIAERKRGENPANSISSISLKRTSCSRSSSSGSSSQR